MEIFSTCWEDKDYPYLQPLPDTPDWREGGEVFCDTKDETILSQVLNDYDLETKDFYRWTTEYSRAEVSDLVRKRSGMDFGTIRDLVPIERGPSGRLKRLKVVGDKTGARGKRGAQKQGGCCSSRRKTLEFHDVEEPSLKKACPGDGVL